MCRVDIKSKKSEPTTKKALVSLGGDSDEDMEDDEDEIEGLDAWDGEDGEDDEDDDEFDEVDEEFASGKKIQMDFGSDDDDEEDDEDEMEVEREAREQDEENAELEALGEEELKTNIEQREKFVLPSGQEIEYSGQMAEDLQLVQTRIQEIVRVLENFKELREEGRFVFDGLIP
jgi:ribosomal RNA methyltransferase Nop2